ncbi:cell division protein FtsX [Prosthecochloris marina]|uniref:Cell division protein FtsX n=1 Tax=Prosthecochloris marina TaxID=2017681 RepID=A0A317T657_9CHLB|nr:MULTISPECIES: permease-like cell division protein FtsX [Prosthecochloris]PWW82143.1 cell division protein FtsX [Prosthecochloris marina]UZJ39764.1 permease-like cell division protein FtsX [Prosthecochloris sp. SCSIO W1102]
MNLFFVIKEGFSGILRAKLPAAVTIVVGFFALVLLGLFATISLSFFDIIDEVRGRVEIEVFFPDASSDEAVQKSKDGIESLDGVKKVTYVSKDSAAVIFNREFGRDIVEILGINPLPRSAKVLLQPRYAGPDSLQVIVASIKAFDPSLDIRYNKVFLQQLEDNARLFTVLTAATGILIAIATVVLVGYTIRLAIYSRQQRIKTMRLVGAANWFISAPYVIEGGIQGVLAGGFASLAIYLLSDQLLLRYEPGIYEVLHPSTFLVYPVLIGLGFFLGIFGSTLSVRKYLRKA